MTKVTVVYKNNNIVSITADGHANFSKNGYDIVCAAISVLMSTAVNALEAVAGLKYFIYESDEKTGYMYIELPAKLSDEQKIKADIVLKTVQEGLKGIAQGYPKNIKLYVEGGANIQ